mgnify:CR=1 FL=1
MEEVGVLTRREAREQRLRDGLDAAHPARPAEPQEPLEPHEPLDPREPREPVRILFVCTGNVIRSALAERALTGQFDLLGIDGISISSAGTRAAVGQGMWRESVEIATAYGIEYRDFVSRQLDDGVLGAADYVIVAAREHRSEVLRRRPDLMRRTFTFRELVRILDADGAAPAASSAENPPQRWIDLATWADGHRSAFRAADPEDDDLVDPRDSGREALWTFERDLIRGVVTIVSAVSGEFR